MDYADPATGRAPLAWLAHDTPQQYAATAETMLRRTPLFVGYGTADVGLALNVILLFEFNRRGKTNLMLHAYLRLDHHRAFLASG